MSELFDSEQFSKIFNVATQMASQMVTQGSPSDNTLDNVADSMPDMNSFIGPVKSMLNQMMSGVDASIGQQNEDEPKEKRTKDLSLVINVSLKDLFEGCVKTYSVKRKINGVSEKKKMTIEIQPGMRDGHVICFENQADEKEGYIRGDVNFTLCMDSHPFFERIGDDLYTEIDISVYESYKARIEFTHIDGTILYIKNDEPLHFVNNIRKIENQGMPIYGTDERGDLFIRFNVILPESLDDDKLNIIREIFPPMNNEIESDDYITLLPASESDIDSDFELSDDDDESDMSDELDNE